MTHPQHLLLPCLSFDFVVWSGCEASVNTHTHTAFWVRWVNKYLRICFWQKRSKLWRCSWQISTYTLRVGLVVRFFFVCKLIFMKRWIHQRNKKGHLLFHMKRNEPFMCVAACTHWIRLCNINKRVYNGDGDGGGVCVCKRYHCRGVLLFHFVGNLSMA